MAEISLCMIVKNEEAVLERCLSRAAAFADEIMIVDTGSTDRTREIGARYADGLYSFLWQDDFAAARNFSFSKGTKDYLMWLDADDVVPEEEAKKILELKKRLDRERPDVVMMRYAVAFRSDKQADLTFWRERLIRNCRQAVWTGRVHEAVPPFGKVVKEEITIEHHKVRIEDPERNLRILESLRKDNAMGPRELYYYGKELCFHGRYSEAARAFLCFLSLPGPGKGWKADGCLGMAHCLKKMGLRQEELRALLGCLEYGTPKPEVCCGLGNWFYREEDYGTAAFWYEAAIRCGKEPGDGGWTRESMREEIPRRKLDDCRRRMERGGLDCQ